MEGPGSNEVGQTPETGREKKYLYHMVPTDMRGTTLHPLNTLKEAHPDVYTSVTEKYRGRSEVTQQFIPTLQCAWEDVLHLTAIHPENLKKALVEAGLQPSEMKFFQVDPGLLDPAKTTVYLYRDVSGGDIPDDDYAPFDPNALDSHAVIGELTKRHYKERALKGEQPLLFVGIPHVLHRGSIDISNLPVITV